MFNKILLTILFALISNVALASEANKHYNYVGASYVADSQFFDNVTGSQYGWEINASKTLGDALYVRGVGARSNGSDVTNVEVAAGLHGDFTSRLSWYGDVFASKLDIDATALQSFDSWGYGAQTGVWVSTINNLSFNVGAKAYRYTANSSWEKAMFGGVKYALFDSLSVLVQAEKAESTNAVYKIGAQLTF